MRIVRGALLAVCFLAVRAAADCPTTVTVTPPNARGIAKLNFQMNGCAGGVLSEVTIETPETVVKWIDEPCGLSCSRDVDTSCWPAGSYKVKVVRSHCIVPNPNEGGNCNLNATGSAETTIVPLGASAPPVLSGTWDASRNEAVFNYDFAHGMTIRVDENPEEGFFVAKDKPGTNKKIVVPSCSKPQKVFARAWRCTGTMQVEVTATVDVPLGECSQEATQCNSCKPACNGPNLCVGEPINVGSGDVSATIDLFTIAQPTEPLRMALTYRTIPPKFGTPYQPLGKWTHTFNQSIVKVGPYRLQWYTATGERYFFDRSTPGHWYAAKPGTSRDRIELQGSEYVILHIDGSKSFFDVTSGRWLRKSDRWGNTITAEYTAGVLSAIIDALGRRISFAYAGGLLSEITLENGAKWRFEGYLDRVYDPLHTGATPWRSITYWNGNLDQIRDEAGAVLEGHTHDGNGRGRWSWRGNQNTDFYDVQYGSGDQRTVIRKLDGDLTQTSTYTVTFLKGEYYPTRIQGGCAGCGAGSSDDEFTYYDDGNLKTHKDARGHTTEYSYDPSGNVISRTEAKGTPRQRQFFYTYLHPTWLNFKTREDVPSAFGRVEASWTWNANETVLTEARTGKPSAEANPVTYTTTTTFDSRHRVLSIDGPRTDVNDFVTYAYYPDNEAEPNRRGRLHTVTNALGHVVTYEDYDVFGTAHKITDPNGVITTIVTDARGRVTSTTNHLVAGDPDETSNHTTSITYDTRDRISKTTSARGFESHYVYQPGTNRLLEIIALNGDKQQVERRRYTYTEAGEKKTEEDQSCNTPAITCTAWTTKRSATYTYDALNRLKEIVHPVPAGAKVIHGYDAEGHLQSIQDERHSAPNTFYDFDEHDRLERVRQVLSTAAGGYAITEYGYDQADNLTSVKDPNGNVTTYQYNDFGYLVKQTSPVTGITTYTYDPAGNLLTTTDANGGTTTRTYDALSRVRTSVSTKTDAPTQTVEWTYDTGTYGIGRLRTMSDPTGSTTYHYDRRGIVKREEKIIRDVAYVTAFRHDADGNRTELMYPSGTKVTYTYDFAGRPVTASAGTTPLVTAAKYAPFGPLTELVFGNNTTRTMVYDTRYRVDENKLTGPAGLIAHYDYVSDAAGNITNIVDVLNAGFTRTFGYDDLNRLTSADTGASLWGTGTYTYDAMGNMTSYALGTWRSGTLTYPSTTPQVGGIVYDAAGNETIQGPLTRKYSPRNQMASLDDEREAAGVRRHIGYGYDGRGVRVWREHGFRGDPSAYPMRRYVYSPELQLLMATHDSRPIGFAKSYFTPLNIKAEYVWFGSLPLATLPPGGAPLTYFTDHLGTPLIQTDASGNVAWRAEYEPYGNIALMRVGNAADQPLRFPGQEYERTWNGAEENYNVYRWYRSGWGRYTQTDPLGLLGGVNLYRYAASDPIANTDRLGLIVGTKYKEMPESKTSEYNCMAWGLGVQDKWIQPCSLSPGSPNTVPPQFGCKEIDCDATVPCFRTKVMVVEDSLNPLNWHVMKQQCGSGWTSKNGKSSLFTGIQTAAGDTGPAAAELFYNEQYKPKGTFDIKCWDCPSKPGNTNMSKPCW